MKYLRKINEGLPGILDAFGLTEEEYKDMIKFIVTLPYSDVKSNIPFFIDIIENDYIMGYDDMRKLINFYNKSYKIYHEMDELEDYFLDIIEEKDPNFIIQVDKKSQSIVISFVYKSLSDISKKLSDIERRIERSGFKYSIESIQNSTSFAENEKSITNHLYLRIRKN